MDETPELECCKVSRRKFLLGTSALGVVSLLPAGPLSAQTLKPPPLPGSPTGTGPIVYTGPETELVFYEGVPASYYLPNLFSGNPLATWISRELALEPGLAGITLTKIGSHVRIDYNGAPGPGAALNVDIAASDGTDPHFDEFLPVSITHPFANANIGASYSMAEYSRAPTGQSYHSAQGSVAQLDPCWTGYFANQAGDWIDAAGVKQGSTPFAKIASPASSPAWTATDVTSLVQKWHTGGLPNFGFAVRSSNVSAWAIPNYADSTKWPTLVLQFSDGSKATLPLLGTQIWDHLAGCFTANSGNTPGQCTLYGPGNYTMYLWGDVASITNTKPVRTTVVSAKLNLWCVLAAAPNTIQVFAGRYDEQAKGPLEPTWGIAAKYVKDIGLKDDPAVHFMENFPQLLSGEALRTYMERTGSGWAAWSGAYKDMEVVADADPLPRFPNYKPIAPGVHSVRCIIAGGTGGGNRYRFRMYPYFKYKYGVDIEPQEMYARWYQAWSDEWDDMVEGGHLSGFAAPTNFNIAGINPGTRFPNQSPWNAALFSGSTAGFEAVGVAFWAAVSNFSMPRDKTADPAEKAGYRVMSIYNYSQNAVVAGSGIGMSLDRARGAIRKTKQVCVEVRVKMNSVFTTKGDFTKGTNIVTNIADVSHFSVGDALASGPSYIDGNGGVYVGSVTQPGGGRLGAITMVYLGGSPAPASGTGTGTIYIGKNDGIQEWWVQGRKALSILDMCYRLDPRVGIQEWDLQVFHGGHLDVPVGKELAMYLGQIVFSSQYIGPMVIK